MKHEMFSSMKRPLNNNVAAVFSFCSTTAYQNGRSAAKKRRIGAMRFLSLTATINK